MNIGILGYGWLGSAIGEHFLAKSNQLFATLRKQSDKEKLDSSIICSLLDLDSTHLDLPHFFSELDQLIIAVPFSRSQQLEQVLVNLEQILEKLPEDCGIIMCSTIGVYTKKDGEVITELSEINSEKADARVEKLIMSLRPNSVVLRLAGLIGKDRNPVIQLSKKAENQGGNSPVNLVHQKDIIHVIDHILEKNIRGHVFNVCSPEHPTKSEYYSKMATVFDVTPPRFESTSSNKHIIDSSQLAQLLNFPFESSIFNR